jgi:hypothetical protein
MLTPPSCVSNEPKRSGVPVAAPPSMRGWCAWLLAGWLIAGIGFAHAGATEPADTLIVARRGWHIDVGIAVGELTHPLAAVASVFPGAKYLFFGFGDRHYLTARHRGAPALLGALWPGPSLLLVTALAATPETAFGGSHVLKLRVPREQSLRAQLLVWQTLTPDQQSLLASVRSPAAEAHGKARAGMPGPYPGSVLLESRATYSGLHTCNTWVAEVLGAAGIPVRSRHVIFAGQLWGEIANVKAAVP